MIKVLNFLLVSLVSVQVFAGPGSSGGGMIIDLCEPTEGQLELGQYEAAGSKVGNALMTYKDENHITITFEKRERNPFNANKFHVEVEGYTDSAGIFHGQGSLAEGRCPFQVALQKVECNKNGYTGVELQLPHWLSEFDSGFDADAQCKSVDKHLSKSLNWPSFYYFKLK